MTARTPRPSRTRLSLAALAFVVASLAAVANTITPPAIVLQATWLAATQPFRADKMQKQPEPGKFRRIVIHNTATPMRAWKDKPPLRKMADYHAMHLANKQKHRKDLIGMNWGGFAYHYHVDVDGTIAEGRSVDFIGDSGTSYDMGGLILVVLEGSFEGGPFEISRSKLPDYDGAFTGAPREVPGKPERVKIDLLPDQPTEAQKKSLDALVAWLSKRYDLDPATIAGHRDFASTSCPGKTLVAYLPELKTRIAKALADDKGR